jgi:RHS repeat-associated protein
LKAGHSNRIFFITDALSTVRDVVNSVGEVKARYEFAEYGARLAPSMTNTVESQKTFVGGLSVQDEVVDTGLMMMGHRFYDPQLGRFLNRDPIGFAGSTNLFEYSASSPVQYVDHQGLQQVGGDWISAVTGQPSVGPQPLTEGELRIYAGMMAMLNEPFDWVMTGEDIYENGFHPSHLLGLLPLVSYGVVQAANKYRRSRAVKAARDRAYVAENCNGFTRVQVSGFPGAHAMIQVQDDVLNFISVSRKGLGPGAGPELLKIALENADVSSVRRAVLRQILEADSLRALQEGFDPVGTRIYNTVRGPIQDVLGKTPTNVRAVRDGGVYNIEMDLK